MADTPQPDNTEWVISKHTTLLNQDEVVGHYPTMEAAQSAFNALLANHQWLTSYQIEHRNKS